MWIRFAFGKKNVRYRSLLDDYTRRVARFVKPGRGKNGGVALCFVASRTSAFRGGDKFDLSSPRVHRLRSEELAELVAEVSSCTAGKRFHQLYNCDLKSPTLCVSVCTNAEEIRPDKDGRTAYVELVRTEITPELSEVLAAEQIYRALMIMNNRTYHK